MWKILEDIHGYFVAWNGYNYMVWCQEDKEIIEGKLDDWQLAQISVCIQIHHATLEYRTKSKTKAIRYLKSRELLT